MSARFELLERRRLYASIAGMVYNDLDGSGTLDGGEAGIPNRTVFLDDDNDGVKDSGEVSVLTDNNGEYLFAGLSAGTYHVRTVVPSGWVQTEPQAGDPVDVFLVNGQDVTGSNFGTHIIPGQTGTISGSVYDDTDGNGALDVGELGLAGETVYLDANNNESRDLGEEFATTDAGGAYVFQDIGIGNYTVRVELAGGETQTFPKLNFGWDVTLTSVDNVFNTADFYTTTRNDIAQVGGLVYNDVNRDGTRDSGDDGLPGITVYLDADDDQVFDSGEQSTQTDTDGFYFFSGLAAGTYNIRQVLQTNFIQTSPAADASQTVVLTAGDLATDQDFGTAVIPSSISGTVFFDQDGDGNFGGAEIGLSARTVYIDADNDNVFDSGETSVVTDANGDYTFDNLDAGTYHIREILRTNWIQTTPSANAAITIVLAQASDVTGNDFGTQPNPATTGTISGTVFDDANGNGVVDNGEVGIDARTVFIDTNNDGQLQGGEESVITDVNGDYSFIGQLFGTYEIRTVIPNGWKQTAPKLRQAITATITSTAKTLNGQDFLTSDQLTLADVGGIVFNDTNRNGVQDNAEVGVPNIVVYIDDNDNKTRDGGEVSTTTDAEGFYFFAGLDPDTYNIRQVLQTNWVQSAPAANASRVVVVVAGDYVDDANFGTVVAPASVAGFVFDDINGDGIKNIGEKGLGSWTVFLDTNNNGVLDGGETSVVTPNSGAYKFSNLDPGTYNVREVLKTGFRATTPTVYTVTLTSTQDLINKNFGNTARGTVSGSVFNDANTNRLRDTGEVGIDRVKVYIDVNENGRLDASEAFVLTNKAGNFTFENVLSGTYQVRVVPPSKYKITTPIVGYTSTSLSGAGTTTGILFGMKLV